MFLTILALTSELAAFLEGNTGGMSGPPASVHKVGIQAEDAQLGLGSVSEPLSSIHRDKDRASSSDIVSVIFIETSSFPLLVKNQTNSAAFPALRRSERLICIWN